MSYEREAAHTVLLMVTPNWWTALEGIEKKYNFFSCMEQKMTCFEECSICSLAYNKSEWGMWLSSSKMA